MKVELYIGYTDHTWEITTVEIPDNTLEKDVERVAQGQLNFSEDAEVAFTGVYHFSNAIDDEDEDDEDEPSPLSLKDRVLRHAQPPPLTPTEYIKEAHVAYLIERMERATNLAEADQAALAAIMAPVEEHSRRLMEDPPAFTGSFYAEQPVDDQLFTDYYTGNRVRSLVSFKIMNFDNSDVVRIIEGDLGTVSERYSDDVNIIWDKGAQNDCEYSEIELVEDDDDDLTAAEINTIVEQIDSGEMPTYPVEQLWDDMEDDDGQVV